MSEYSLDIIAEWSLRELFEEHKFSRIQGMDYGQSCIPNVELVENKGWHEMSICLEVIK